MVWSREREREGEDGKEREGGQRVDQNVGQKDIKRETEAKKKRRKRRRRSQPHTALPLFLKVKENRSVKRRERRRVPSPSSSSSSQSFPSSSRRSISRVAPPIPTDSLQLGFLGPCGPPFEWLMTLCLCSCRLVKPLRQTISLWVCLAPNGVETEREMERESLEGRVDRHTLGWEGEERVSILERRRRRRPEEMRG